MAGSASGEKRDKVIDSPFQRDGICTMITVRMRGSAIVCYKMYCAGRIVRSYWPIAWATNYCITSHDCAGSQLLRSATSADAVLCAE